MAAMTLPVSAEVHDLDHKFDMTKAITSKTTITVLLADNVQAACEKESRRVGNQGFRNQIQACAFWYKDSCTVILPRQASMHQAGHEFLHCILGSFH